MKDKSTHAPLNSELKDKENCLKFIKKEVEKGTQKKLAELKEEHSEENLFYIALKHVTTTKKAICKALDIGIDNACWYKRDLEKEGLLVQSMDEVRCPYTKNLAHNLTTNPANFEDIRKTNQLKLF
ncbi:MAG: hypothetical protein MK105_05850 [Crocinitomicaceae bacterium]|nr:hypothetical protein [Crocinitomicaceae bacterium]